MNRRGALGELTFGSVRIEELDPIETPTKLRSDSSCKKRSFLTDSGKPPSIKTSMMFSVLEKSTGKSLISSLSIKVIEAKGMEIDCDRNAVFKLVFPEDSPIFEKVKENRVHFSRRVWWISKRKRVMFTDEIKEVEF